MKIKTLLFCLTLVLSFEIFAQCEDYVITGNSADGATVMNSYGVTTDDSGNMYIMGSIDSTLGSFNAQLMENSFYEDGGILFASKLDPAGNAEWLKTIDIKEVQNQHRIHADGDGIYLITNVQDSFRVDGQEFYNEYPSLLIVKYNDEGNVQWTRNYETDIFDMSTSTRLWANGLTSDKNGNILVTGFFQGKFTVEDYIFETGQSGFHREAYVLKISEAGDVIWATQSRGNETETTLYNRGWAITCDDNDDVIVGGLFRDEMTLAPITVTENSSAFTPYVAKLDGTNGSCLWIQGAEMISQNRFGNFYGVATDSKNNVIAVGLADSSFSIAGVNVDTELSKVIILTKFDENGNLKFVKNYGDNVNRGGMWGAFVETGSNDEIYFGGTTYGNTAFDNFTTNRYGVFIATMDSLGNTTDLHSLGSSADGTNSTFYGTCDNFGNVIVSGRYGNSDALYDIDDNVLIEPQEEDGIFLWKTCLEKETTSISEQITSKSFFNVAPNPSNGNFILQYESVWVGKAQFTLINEIGQTIYENRVQLYPGKNSLSFNLNDIILNGIYFLKINGEGFEENMRVIVNK